MKWWARRRLRPKIFVPFSGLIFATLLSTLWLINSAVSYQAENTRPRNWCRPAKRSAA